jgi:hypothetical protein
MPHRVGHGQKQRLWLHFNTLEPLALGLFDYHNKSDFDGKPFSLQYEGSVSI